ncbi:MAG: hypothetical protein WDN75_10100 [Bacteroidota bacterium]
MGTDHEKVAKFIGRIEGFVLQLDDQHQLNVHTSIDQFYYMTRAEELKFLLVQYAEEAEKLQAIRNRIEEKYRETFNHWRRDTRWLNNHLIREK